MAPRIEYFITCVSPWTYLGHDAFIALARAHRANVDYRPVNLGKVFPETGGLPLAKRAPARQRYRMVELQRWRERRGLPLNLQPAHFPTDASLADRCVLAIAQGGGDPADFLGLVLRAVWADQLQIADAGVIGSLLRDTGHDPAAVLAAADGAAAGAAYEANAQEAVERSIFGAPTYVLNGEPFWGQDRIDLLSDALESGRAPYLP